LQIIVFLKNSNLIAFSLSIYQQFHFIILFWLNH